MLMLASSALLFCSAANAQYVWLDDKGVKQFSDQPPPASVPAKRVIKGPNVKKVEPKADAKAEATGTDGEKEAPTASAPANSPKPPPTLAERNADFQKRKAEQAEKEKKAAEEAQRSQDLKKQCDRLAAYQRTLETSGRISQTNKNGERELLNDQQIEQEKREVKRNLENCK
ncbi:MAG: DUF4124 domain-containing protein [Burkholderiales bacterium]|nr:DUF4124 domain-containing protein [Burkholderiales bacterium]